MKPVRRVIYDREEGTVKIETRDGKVETRRYRYTPNPEDPDVKLFREELQRRQA